MSSPSSTGTQQAITSQQISIEQQQNQLAQANQAQGSQLMQPEISQLTALAGGDKSAIMTALAPYLTNITQSTSQAQGQIKESIAPGVGQDVALANLKQGENNSIASTTNSLVAGAPAQLAQLGAGIESFGLSDVGAAISSASGAASSNQATMQAQSSSKASTLGFLGSLAGAAAGGAGAAIGCWIAEAIYGVNDLRTDIVRSWLTGAFMETLVGAAIMWLYLRVGRAVARRVARSGLLRRILKPLFDMALRAAIERQATTEAILYAG